MIKVDIIDDQVIILNGLQKILAGASNIAVNRTYTDGHVLLQDYKISLPDVLLLDIQMPAISGFELAAAVHKSFPTVRMIALTNVDVLTQVKMMLQQGCLGYLLKDVQPDVLIRAIETVYEGKQFLNETFQAQLLQSLSQPNAPAQLVTRREKEILKLIIEENTNQEIANKLYISLRTVENHRNNLLQKLKVRNTAGLVKLALQDGLIN